MNSVNKNLAFVAYYQKANIYSFNALIGAIETDVRLEDIPIFFSRGEETLIANLENLLKSYNKVVAGISFFTTQLWEIYNLLKTLRRKFDKKVMLIAGGPHPTGDPQGALRMGFDLVVIGEGEETIIDLLVKIKFGKNLYDTKGIAFIDDNANYHYTGKRKRVELDKFPPFPYKHLRFGAIEITRGCPYGCHFCQTPFILGSYPRHRSIESICQAVKILKQHDKTDIRFITPNAFSYGSPDGKKVNIAKLEELLINIHDLIKPEGKVFLGSFPSEVRPEHVTTHTLNLVLNYAANDNIAIGAQSGSQDVLDACNRGHTVKEIFNAVQKILNSGLKANVDFIFGLPNETEADIDKTIKVIKELASMGARIHTHSFIPLPKTAFEKEPVRKISNHLREILQELNSKGIAYGEWKKQEAVAVKIAEYLRTRKFE